MPVDTRVLSVAMKSVGENRARLVRELCRTEDDLTALATVHALEAQHIWEQLGGQRLAAAQFYAFADRNAAPPPPPDVKGGDQ